MNRPIKTFLRGRIPRGSQRIKLGGTMGPHREGTGTIVGREAILKVLESYGPSAIRIATIGSHSALDVCDGAVEEGFPTLVICEKGRATPYARYFRSVRDKEGRAVRGMVDEAIVLSKFQEVLSEKMQDRLRRSNAVFIPNRSFTSYCDLDEIERSFRVPLFGSRNLLRTEEREEERSYYWILEKAGLPAPEKIEDPKDIDGLVIVKLHHNVKKLERGFFTAANFKEYKAKSAALLKQGVISTRDLAKARIERYIIGPIFNFDFFYSPIETQGEKLELLGIDWRFETSLDGHVRLPADQQLTLDESQRIPEYVVVGHNSATLRESSLGAVFDIAERYVRATQEHFRPGIIGPFTLQTDDPRSEVFLRRPHIPLGDVKHRAQAGLAQGRAVVSHDDVFRNALGLVKRQLLVRGQTHVAVERRLEAPVDPEELEPLPLGLDRGVEEIEVEDRTDDVPLNASLRQGSRRDDTLFEERRRFRLIFLEVRGGEESPLQLLDVVMQFHDDEAVDVLRVLDFLWSGKPGLFEDPVVTAFLLPLLRAQEVPAAEERHAERSLDFVEIAIRREGSIRDEDRVRLAQAVLHLLAQHVLEFRKDDRLVDHAADRAAFLVPYRAEVSRVWGGPSFFAYHEGRESFLDRPIAHVEGGVRANRRDPDGGRTVRLQDFQNRLAADDRPRPLPVRPHGTSEFNPLGPRKAISWRNVFIGRFASRRVGHTTGQMVGMGLGRQGPPARGAPRARRLPRGPIEGRPLRAASGGINRPDSGPAFEGIRDGPGGRPENRGRRESRER